MAASTMLTYCNILTICLVGIVALTHSQPTARRAVNPIHVDALRKELMFPYDAGHRRTEITNANYQSQIRLNFQLPYYGSSYDYTWVSLHGYLGFHHAPVSPAYPIKVPRDNWPANADAAFIAPFYMTSVLGTATDTAKPSGVYYKEYVHLDMSILQDEIDLQEALRLDIQHGMIGATDFVPKHALIVTWKNISFAGSTDLKQTNTYQLVIATDDFRCYILFNYDLVLWTSSTTSHGDAVTGLGGSPALVGFNAGNGTRAFEYMPYSQTYQVLQLTNLGHSNGHAGRHIFRIDEQITQGNCNYEPDHIPILVMSPDRGHMFGGTLVNITGPCFDPNLRMQVKFHDQQVPCVYHNRNLATFVTPMVKTVGFVEVTAILESGAFHFVNKFYIENPIVATELVWFDNKYQLNSLQVDNFHVYWQTSNISYPLTSTKVHINLFGYGESGLRPDLVLISQLKDSPNTGSAVIDGSTAAKQWHMDLKIGLIQVNTTQKVDGHTLTTSLWSRPFPLAWYFRNQWEKELGSNWTNAFCKQWLQLESRRPPLDLSSLPTCPCTYDQAMRDMGRFAPDPDCDEWGSRECHGNEKSFHCVMSTQPTPDGAGQHCCYGFDGELLTLTDNKIVGHPFRAHPMGLYPYDDVFGKTPGLSHWHQDLWGHFTCCRWEDEIFNDYNGTCEAFIRVRPPNHCDRYQPTNPGMVFGDPHLITFNGNEYSFNGKGEFTLLNVNDQMNMLDAQVRLQPFVSIKGNDAPISTASTVITSFAAKEKTSPTVEVHIRRTEERWRYRLTVAVDGKSIYFDRPQQQIYNFNGVTIYTPSNVHNQSHVVIGYESGAGIEVYENRGFMAVRVSLPSSFKGITRALLGNWANQSNDLAIPDGSFVDSNTTFAQIHTDFGMKWLVTDLGTDHPNSKTIFHYDHDRTSSYYFDPDFRPVFEKVPTIPNTVDKTDLNRLCGLGSNHIYQCLFDYAVSGNRELAVATKTFYDDFMMIKNAPEVKGRCPPLRLRPNVHLSSTVRIIGTVVRFGCGEAFRLEGTTSRVCQQDHEWSKLVQGEPRCVSLR